MSRYAQEQTSVAVSKFSRTVLNRIRNQLVAIRSKIKTPKEIESLQLKTQKLVNLISQKKEELVLLKAPTLAVLLSRLEKDKENPELELEKYPQYLKDQMILELKDSINCKGNRYTHLSKDTPISDLSFYLRDTVSKMYLRDIINQMQQDAAACSTQSEVQVIEKLQAELENTKKVLNEQWKNCQADRVYLDALITKINILHNKPKSEAVDFISSELALICQLHQKTVSAYPDPFVVAIKEKQKYFQERYKEMKQRSQEINTTEYSKKTKAFRKFVNNFDQSVNTYTDNYVENHGWLPSRKMELTNQLSQHAEDVRPHLEQYGEEEDSLLKKIFEFLREFFKPKEDESASKSTSGSRFGFLYKIIVTRAEREIDNFVAEDLPNISAAACAA
jgi:hypothetical protein